MIVVEDLTYTYPKETQSTIHGIHFTVERGEIFGFLGPSGAGKSTCQKILHKILHNYSGRITVDGKPLKSWGQEYFERIGVCFEFPNHYHKLTALENLRFFSAFYSPDRMLPLDDVLEIVGLLESGHKRVETYSKGMKIRLNFARAIMHNPDILFLDEPTSGLDPVNARKIKDRIIQLKNEGKTIFITTHDMSAADELCDRLAFIVDGAIIVTDEPQHLKRLYGEDTVAVDLKNGQSATFPLEHIGSNPAFLQFLKNDRVLRIHTQEATLEKVFVQVTGKSLNP